jgi:hypothetical protein
MADFGEKVRREKQAGIRKPLMKSPVLHCPLAFLSRFTKPGHEPFYVADAPIILTNDSARGGGSSDEELFTDTMSQLRALGTTQAEIDEGLHTARTADEMLAKKGRLTPGQAQRANEKVAIFQYMAENTSSDSPEEEVSDFIRQAREAANSDSDSWYNG